MSMGETRRYLAFDLGAESGRAVLGTLADGRIALEEIHRFPTEGIVVLGTRQWDVTRIYAERDASRDTAVAGTVGQRWPATHAATELQLRNSANQKKTQRICGRARLADHTS